MENEFPKMLIRAANDADETVMQVLEGKMAFVIVGDADGEKAARADGFGIYGEVSDAPRRGRPPKAADPADGKVE